MMGDTLNKRRLKALAADPLREDDFLNEFAQVYGSACETWMSVRDRKALRQKYASGKYDFKCVSADESNAAGRVERRRHDALLKHGWKLLAYEQNFNLYDAVLFKAKRQVAR